MEVKIKQGEEMLDATIEMVDGVMVVSPKEVKFEPKDGDVVAYFNDGKPTIYIYKDGHKYNTFFYVAYSSIRKQCFFCTGGHLYMDRSDIRPATEEEKQKLFDKLKEEGYEWKPDTKELIKLKWKPMAGQRYYIPAICNAQFNAVIEDWSDDAMDVLYFDKGWVFRTKEECQEFCNRLNDAINPVKP